jgi:CheY-like chemotaxis protein
MNNKKVILVVDDDIELRQMYKIRLESGGYKVVEAGNGEEAMARAVEQKPDCILLDVMMPRVNGFDVLDILKTTKSTKAIPVIILTALMQDDTKKRVKNSGAAGFLVKAEVVPSQVVDVIDQVLNTKTL